MVRMGRPARERAPRIWSRQLEVHRHHHLCARLSDCVQLGAGYAARDLGELHREGATEPAALLGGLHLAQPQVAHFPEQPPGPLLDSQPAQGVTAIVIRDQMGETRSHVFHAGHFQQKPGKLPHPGLQPAGLFQPVRLFVEEIRKMMRDHGGAGSRGDHHVVGVAKDLQEMARHLPRLLAITAVEGGLAAAGLGLGEIDRVADSFQHVRHGHADLREKLLDDAGYEQRNPRHESEIVALRPLAISRQPSASGSQIMRVSGR